MCVNLHIFRNFLVEIKQFAAIFLCIPTFKPVTVRFRISGRGDLFSILHHLGASLCLTAAVKVHSMVSLHLAPMCVNLHIFRNFLVEVKRFTAIFLCIPTFKPVTVRFRIIGRGDNSFILHHFAGSLCLTAVVKAHSMGAIKVLRFIQQGIYIFKIIFLCKSIPLFLGSCIMQFH